MGDTQEVVIEPSWRSLSAWVMAAYRGDARAHLKIARGFSQTLTLRQQRAMGLYLGFLLRAGAILRLGREPLPEELGSIAVSVHPKVAVVVRVDPEAIERVLQMAFDFDRAGEPLDPGLFAGIGSATLGAMLTYPDSELPRLKAALEGWCRTNLLEIQEVLGPTE